MDVLLNMANSLSNDDSLKSYLLQVINNLKFKLGKSLSVPIDTRERCNGYSFFLTLAEGGEENKLSTDLNKIPLELVNVSGVYILYHKDQKNFYIGSASSTCGDSSF